MTNRKKNFIAGAVCPSCSNTDSLVLYADDQSLECMDCGFVKSSEQRDDSLDAQNKSPETNTKFKNASLDNQINIVNLDE